MDEDGGQQPHLGGQWVGLAEALAWLMTRDAKFATDFRVGCLKDIALPFSLRSAPERGVAIRLSEAEKILLDALQHGYLIAHGRLGTINEVIQPAAAIHPANWQDLRFGLDEGARDVARSEGGEIEYVFWASASVAVSGLDGAVPGIRRNRRRRRV